MFIVRFIISLAIVGLAAYLGNLKANKLKNREYVLRDMVTFLGLVENEIRYMMSILPNAYEAARQKINSGLKEAMGAIVVDMLSVENMYLIDQSIVTHISKLDMLTEYDKSVFISTLKNLGRSDLESQMNIIENGKKIIENQIQEANESKLKNVKLYRTVGMITGIMIVIIFI